MADILNKDLIENLMKSTVEGTSGSVSLAYVEGDPHIAVQSGQEGEPNLKVLSEFLRSKSEFSSELRIWLADLCDPDAKSQMMLVIKKRRTGRPKGTMTKHWAAVEEFRQLNAPHAYHAAILQVMNEYGITHSTLTKAIKVLGPALDEIDLINREG